MQLMPLVQLVQLFHTPFLIGEMHVGEMIHRRIARRPNACRRNAHRRNEIGEMMHHREKYAKPNLNVECIKIFK